MCKLKNEGEVGDRDLRTAKLLLKYGANPSLETAEVSSIVYKDLVFCRVWKLEN